MKGAIKQIVAALATDGTLDAALLAEDATATIELSAQAHLERFYGSLGFRAFGTPYDEDGISHIDMRLDSGKR